MFGSHKPLPSLIAAEPYRAFFPLALLTGIAGVLIWPLVYGGYLSLPNAPVSHARLMLEGFVGGFAVGFLGTAAPKMLDTAPLRISQLATLVVLHLTLVTLHATGHTRAGDATFAIFLGLFLAWIGLRVIRRGTLPPPGLPMAGTGFLCALGATIWLAVNGRSGSAHSQAFAADLLYQAFILLPLLGIGGYIFPMILGSRNHHGDMSSPRSPAARKTWRKKVGEGLLVSALIILSYWVESRGEGPMMPWLRALLACVWIGKESGAFLRTGRRGVMAWSLRLGILCLLSGLVLSAAIKRHSAALDHLLYIGGFGLITMTVATRVIYGHSGQGEKFHRWGRALTAASALLLLGMLTRVTADFMPDIRVSHHIYAAGCWVAVSLIWGCAILPSVRKQPPEKKIQTRAPSLMQMNFRK